MYSYGHMPYTLRLSFQLLMILLAGLLIYFCTAIVVPVYFSLLLAILVLPLNNKLERWGFPKAAAVFLSILTAIIVLSGLLYFLSAQMSNFLQDAPAIRDQVELHYTTLQKWIANRFNIDAYQQAGMLAKVTASMKTLPDYVEQTFLTATQTITFIALTSVYAFLMLYYRHMIHKFLLSLFRDKKNVNEVLDGSKDVIKRYMQGLVIEMFIVAVLNVAALVLIGIKYAVFLGVFAAILNIIPFIGIFSGIVFTVLVTLTTAANMSQVIWIILSLSIIHFIDSNILMPKIVGSRVKINALVTVIAAMIGGALMGLGGVFLALPTVAILKIIFDRVEELKPWSILMGDETVRPIGKIKKKISLEKS